MQSTLSAWSRQKNIGRFQKRLLGKEVQKIIADKFPDLIRSNESCALLYLALERSILQSSKMQHSERWLTRLNWPLTSDLASLVWEVSEVFESGGRTSSARKIWKYLSEKAPQNSFEKQMADFKLNPDETENERLWSNKK